MKSLRGVKAGDRLWVVGLRGGGEVVGDARWHYGLYGTVHRVYHTPINRDEPTVELEFASGQRYVYIAEEVAAFRET